MSGATPPPTVGDLEIAAAALGWPVVECGGRRLDSEPAWRAFVQSASPEERLALWEMEWDTREAGTDADDDEEGEP